MNQDANAKHHLSELLTPKQYELSKLLGEFYGYRLENYKIVEIEKCLIDCLIKNST